MKTLSKITSTVRSWNNRTHKYDYTHSFAFDSRETYLEFTEAWKKEYADLSAAIRAEKLERRQLQIEKQYAGGVQSSLMIQKNEANRLMSLRCAGKVEAEKQWKAAHNAAVAGGRISFTDRQLVISSSLT